VKRGEEHCHVFIGLSLFVPINNIKLQFNEQTCILFLAASLMVTIFCSVQWRTSECICGVALTPSLISMVKHIFIKIECNLIIINHFKALPALTWNKSA